MTELDALYELYLRDQSTFRWPTRFFLSFGLSSVLGHRARAVEQALIHTGRLTRNHRIAISQLILPYNYPRNFASVMTLAWSLAQRT